MARENLALALRRVEQNAGAPGIDGMSTKELRSWLKDQWPEIRSALEAGTYRPQPVRRVMIPKPSGGLRMLGVPAAVDRLICQAIAQVLTPVFDPNFHPNSFGYRPGRSQHDAVERARQFIADDAAWCVEVDLDSFFGQIDSERLVRLVSRRIADGYILALIRAWLRAGVIEGDRFYRNQFGVPQGGPVSPLLANIYLHELDRSWIERGYEQRWGLDAKLIRYADDILIVSSKPVGERLRAQLAEILAELGLTLSAEKTRVTTAAAGFDFLGFRFHRRYSGKHGREVTYCFPTPAAGKRARERVRAVLASAHGRGESLAETIGQLNLGLRGWTNYYAHTNASRELTKLQRYTNARLRRHLRRRRQASGLGRYREMPDQLLYEKLGLASIRFGHVRYVAP